MHAAIRNLGGHDLGALADAYDAIDDTRPTVIFAYTVKGYGLATQGHPQNHSSLLTETRCGRWRRGWAPTSTTRGRPFPPGRPPTSAPRPPPVCAGPPRPGGRRR